MVCYNFKKNIFNNPIFENSIDATYIIHLIYNKRLEHVINQLKIYHPTKIVYILFNRGYKKCKKKKFIINPPLDLVDCNIHIFKHAKSLNYNNILILEDDFIFNKEILNIKHIYNIENFLIKKKNDNFIYLLGCLPLFMIPYNSNTYQYVINLGAHSVIYSKNIRNKILNLDQKLICDWDLLLCKYITNKYCYYKPLCYQLFYETDNSKHWGINSYFYNILKYLCILVKYLFKIFKMDIKPEPGFSYFYIFGKLFWFIIFIIFIILQ